jgi:hypothetical protein
MTKTTRFSGLALGIGTLAILVAGPTNAFASPIPIGDGGILIISNVSGVSLGLTTAAPCFNWGGGSTCAGATHSMAVSGSSADFVASTFGTITDLSSFGPISDFETVTGGTAVGGATVHFDLTSIVLNGAGFGNCTSNSANNACGPANSPLVLQEDNTGTQVSLSFTALLDAYTGTSATGVTPYRAIFATQFSGPLSGTGACNGELANITDIVTCEAAGGTIDSPWSASESPTRAPAPVPEPATLTLTGLGIAAAVARRRGSSSAS